MSRPLLPLCPAGVNEVVPTVVSGPLMAETTIAAAQFTTLLTSFPQLKSIGSARRGRMKNLTPPGPLHSSRRPSGCPGDPVMGRVMTGRQTCDEVQRQLHGWATSQTSGDAAGASKSACARTHPTDKGQAVGHWHQPTARLEQLSAKAARGEPNEQLITIESNNVRELQNWVRPQGASRPTTSRVRATPKQAHLESRRLDSEQLAAATASATHREGRKW